MTGLTVLAVVFTVYALVAGRIDRLSITAPMVFVVAGGILGPGGADLLKVSLSSGTSLVLTEITLALLLFTDAATVPFRDIEGDMSLPSRLLLIGLPLTVALGAALEQCIGVRQIIEVGEGSGVGDLLGSLPEAEPGDPGERAPTLIRRTPSAAASATVMNGVWISRFTGLGATADTMAETCSAVSIRGA